MKTAKTSKRALLCSVLSIALCLSMLIGTTFAWFTDTASASVSKITSGTLDVEIRDKDNAPISELNWVKAAGHENEKVLWEPGCTYTLTPFKIANVGTLALKYKMVVTGFTGDKELMDVIKFTYTMEDNTEFALDTYQPLGAGITTGLITVTAKMDTDAGNDYQGKTLDGISIRVYATQDTVEYDSTGKNYDKDADMTPDNLDKMVTANVTVPVAAEGETAISNADNTVYVEVPADAVAEGATELKLTVQPSSTAAEGISIKANQGFKAYDISVTGLKAGNSAKIPVSLFVGKGLTKVSVYHNHDLLGEADSFSYDPESGYVSFKTTSFSPFTVVYDEVATVNGVGYATIQAAVNAAPAGAEIKLTTDVIQNSRLELNKDLTLNLNGKKIYNTIDLWDITNAVIGVSNGATVTINGNGVIQAKKDDCYAIDVVDGNLTIEDGEIIGNISAVQLQKGSLTVLGGTFSQVQESKWGDKYLLNCIDAAFQDGSAKISVKGGSFKGFNPADAKGEPTNPTSWVAAGYTVTESGGVYTVSPVTAE